MLYFSKTRILLVIIVTIFFVYLSSSNFFKNKLIDKNINLGLDLQGGSYLLLEIDNKPVIIQKLQLTVSNIKKNFKDKNIEFKNLKIEKNNSITFEINLDQIKKAESILLDKESPINMYFPNYKSYEYNLNITDQKFDLTLSKYGLIEIKNSSLDQALEIVRRRIDEVGTNEPNILKRGNDRILVELPGLDDPMRIKKLLGKTANLAFRFVSHNSDSTFGVEKLFYEDQITEAYVSKRIILSGENLLDAQARMDSQANETVVSFSLDRVGTKRFAKATSTNIGKQLAIILDGKIISAPVIRDAIVGGSGQISGNFTFQSATDLALLLRSGALPAPMNIIEERTVGPDLGQDSINAGVFALIIGFLLVIIFMGIKYRFFAGDFFYVFQI